jgi:hypothetical protein
MLRNKSILQKDMSECFICGTTRNLVTHEIFYGSANREKSIRYGAYVRLCTRHHTTSNYGVHFNPKLNEDLRKMAQKKLEEMYGHEWFMETFGKNYL